MDQKRNSEKKSYKKTETRRRRRRSKTDEPSQSQPVRFEEVEDGEGAKKVVEVRRRRRRRSRQPQKEKEKRQKLFKKTILLGVVGIFFIIISLYFFMITWISGQGFKNNVSSSVSELIDQDVSFGEFSLKGLNLRSKAFKINSNSNDVLLLDANLELLQTRIHPLSFLNKNWSMGDIQARSGNLLFGKENSNISYNNIDGNFKDQKLALTKAGIGLNSNPDHFEFNRLSVDKCNFEWQGNGLGRNTFINDANLIISDISSSGISMDLIGGDLLIPFWPDLSIKSVSGKVRKGDYLINQSSLGISQGGELKLSGKVSIKGEAEYQISSDFSNVNIGEFLSTTWIDKVEGVVDGGINVSGSLLEKPEMKAEGGFSGSNILLMRNPILSFLSKALSEPALVQARIENLNVQFNRNLNDVEIYNLSGQSLPLLKFSNGKVKISKNNNVEGDIRIGVVNEILNRPGIEKKNEFLAGDEFSWVTLDISGTINDPILSLKKLTSE
ncbi:MAG: hypothetical protein ACJ0KA_07510 [Verrucomicrobiales bacterium]